MTTKNTKTAAVHAAETANTNTGVSAPGQYNFYKEKVDEDSGEVTVVPKYKYMSGMPREYRYDGKKGQLLLGAETPVGKTFKIHPIAWCFFNDALFGQKMNFWCELYFLDAQKCVACVMFHGASAVELQKIAEPLYYQDRNLNDVVIDVYSTEHTNSKISPPAKYTIARFDRFEDADRELVKEMKAFVKEFPIYRASSVTTGRQIIASKFWYNPLAGGAAQELEQGTGAEDVTESDARTDDDGNDLPF